MTEARMLSEMTASEFRRWEIFEQVEPFGEKGHYLRNALLCLVVAKCAGVKNVKIEDFVIDTLKGEPPKQSPEAVRNMLKMMMDQQNKYVAEQEARKISGGDSGNRTA